ncbi:pyruvate, phosphate dikinase [SAR202 cluster bacterium AD-804-J14_MRT_500m]|nr:pyruvate, phosphate dikinase [SAR202 cluster bacterium AD-804-J14_MRT_500m]
MVQVEKYIYKFSEGNAQMKNLLGGKGANLSEMVNLGLPVPPGFVITTDVCLQYYELNRTMPLGLWEDIESHVHDLELDVGRGFGDADNPLLVSVRSGARFSMPGMMDTILNLGLNEENINGLGRVMGDRRSALDAYRRFLQIFSNVAMGVPGELFEEILDFHKQRAGVVLDHELSEDQLVEVIAEFKQTIVNTAGKEVPRDPWDQLYQAVRAVFESWNNDRAIEYRNYRGIPHDLGTAVNIMAMVFGNTGSESGTGVLFTRDPSTGERKIFGEYLANAQGEDVVAGVRTPEHVTEMENTQPAIYRQLMDLALLLEGHYRDVQDVEFTVEHGRLFLLQTRNAQRTVSAAVRAAVDMVKEGLISTDEAIQRVDARELDRLFVPRFDLHDRAKAVDGGALLTRGMGASPGAATGKAYFTADRAAEAGRSGEVVIMMRPETNPDDINGIIQSAGILTSRGGTTSHAAVVTRGLGKPCIVGAEEIVFSRNGDKAECGGRPVYEGDQITIDGTTGEVFLGHIAIVSPDLEDMEEATQLLAWADGRRRLGVMANADTEADAKMALSLGAEGIGLCRTEHMFLGPERVATVQKVLLNASVTERWEGLHPEIDLAAAGVILPEDTPTAVRTYYGALQDLEKLQIQDFTNIFRVMGKRPVIIRLLDAPLHEFLPRYEDLLLEVSSLRENNDDAVNLKAKEEVLALLERTRESNPMLGHRGCRLGITFPSIYRMQVTAIITASCGLVKEGYPVHPEIMIPLTSHVNEMRVLRERLTEVIENVEKEYSTNVEYMFGTMIEVPRAALTADQVAEHSDFFSFGTNDLTQTTYGYSRDDAEGKFLRSYIETGILPKDPFVTIDVEGVGELIRLAVEKGKLTRPNLEVGICGEHGGDPESVQFCHDVGLDYVSSSPYRVPIARLAAAQAAMRNRE